MTQFTQAIAGDRAEVVQLIPSNVGIHDFQAKPRDVETIAEADVLVQNGVGLETFLTDLIRNAANPDLTIVEASEGIPTVSSPDHGEESHAEDDGHNHSHGGVNPHLWLDPVRAITQVENIRQGLVAADPQGQEIYEANAAAYIQALKDLNQELGALLSPYAGQTFVTFHDFAVYFAQRYGLRVEFLVAVPEVSPSPQDLQRIIDLIKAENIRALLTEPAAGKESLSALAQDLQLEISVFDPLESGDSAPEAYFKIMRQNAENIANAMSPDS
jgi:zinc/manganese transport system substrate-binding protein